MAAILVIPFLADNNCPESVIRYLTDRSHDVVRVRDIMPADSPDPVVAQAAMQADRVLIGWDKDFTHQRFLAPRFKKLSRIGFSCLEENGAARLEALIDLVEGEASRRTKDTPMVIKIGKDKIQIGR